MTLLLCDVPTFPLSSIWCKRKKSIYDVCSPALHPPLFFFLIVIIFTGRKGGHKGRARMYTSPEEIDAQMKAEKEKKRVIEEQNF